MIRTDDDKSGVSIRAIPLQCCRETYDGRLCSGTDIYNGCVSSRQMKGRRGGGGGVPIKSTSGAKQIVISRGMMMLFTTTLLFLTLPVVTAAPSPPPPSNHEELLHAEREELARQWAPLVWLHSNEHFYPSSVFHFLQHVKPSILGGKYLLAVNNGDSEVIFPSLPKGRSSWDAYLLASFNTECHNCRLPKFLYGKKPGRNYSPPTYAVIHSCSNTREKKRDSTDPETPSYQGFLNDDANTEDPSSFDDDFSLKYESPSLPDQTTSSIRRETSDTPTVFAQTPQLNSKINITHTDNDTIRHPFLQLQNDFSQSQFLKTNAPTSNSTDINTNINTTLANSSLNINHLNSKNNSDNSVENVADISSKSPNNITDEPKNLHATLPPNDQEAIITHNTVLNPSDENTYRSQIKDKRNVIYNSNTQFSVTYWMFYPYNYGKELCTANLGFFGRIPKLSKNGVCYGEKIAMGNHIGDWEHITIQFKGRIPTKLYISSHNFGAFYTYDAHNHVFHYTSQDNRKGIPMAPQYPPFLELQDTHPIVFTALGSHGLWPTQGTHQYNGFPLLEDKTEKGTRWQTWQNLEIIDLKFSHALNPFERHWLSYEGRWGNPSSNCYTLMGGFCEINQGPTGIPGKRINFPCTS